MKVLNFFKEKNNELSQIIGDTEELKSMAQTLFSQSEKLNQMIGTVKESIEKSSSASHEISATVSTTSSAASDLERTANQSLESMEKSASARKVASEFMKTVESSIMELQNSVNSGLNEISAIVSTMGLIQEKSKMINEIVFQTKLLSFNASVEAARAGEYGKGFSVVASEMGNLANLSGAVSKEIDSIIKSGVEKTKHQIQTVTQSLNKAVNNATTAIENANSGRKEVGIRFNELNQATALTNEKAKQISVATKEQALGVSEINKALEEIERTTHQLEQMAKDNNSSSINMDELIESFSKKILLFAKKKNISIQIKQTEFDFHAAKNAHIDWKMKLGKYLENPDGTLEHGKVCKDNLCVLGKWLYGDGQAFKHDHADLFESLRLSHAEFHKIAGLIIESINTKNFREATLLLKPNGEYSRVSEETVSLIDQLQKIITLEKQYKKAN
ncbi:MAG: hypothetical protein B7Y39_11830 [Bdellovibrio sp. 28-41-41]|nr:MAG: hypothetical protein B7Y39_11830 [Bdellovibrio sp. 28-41-41]